LCEARTTKRSNEIAFRQARRQLNLYRRPVTIAPGSRAPAAPEPVGSPEISEVGATHSGYSTPPQGSAQLANLHYNSPQPSYTTPEQAFSSPESLHGFPIANYNEPDLGNTSMAFDTAMYYGSGSVAPQYSYNNTYGYSAASTGYAPLTPDPSMAWSDQYDNDYGSVGAAQQMYSGQAPSVSNAYRSGTLYSPTPGRPSTSYPTTSTLEGFAQYDPTPSLDHRSTW
jgi:hypothetical protein